MFFFNVLLITPIKEVSHNALRYIEPFAQYPKEMVHKGDAYVYGTIHNGAAVYYRESWLRTGV